MSAYTPIDDIAVAFARVYGAVVDQVDVLPNELPAPRPGTKSPRGRGPLVAIGAAVAVMVAVGSVALLQQEPPAAEEAPIERIALLDPPPELGSPVTLAAVDLQSIPPADIPPPMETWRWEGLDDSSQVAVLIETEPDAAMGEFLGVTVEGGKPLAPPTDGGTTTFESDFGWIGRSWMEGDSWRIALGSDDAVVTAVTDGVVGARPEEATIEGLRLAEGPTAISVDGPVETIGMEFRSPAGPFFVGLMKGVPFYDTLLRIQMPGAESTHVNGAAAVMAELTGDEESELEIGPLTMLAWPVDERSSAVVWSNDLDPALVTSIAEAIEPVTPEQWDEMVVDVPPPSAAFEVEGLQPVSDQAVIAAGEDWEVRAQTFTTSETDGALGLCGWVVLEDTGELADAGCAGAPIPFGQVTPFQVDTSDGLLITAAAPSDVAEVRIGATDPNDEVTTQIQIVDPAVPFGWWAVLVPDGGAYTDVTYWDEDGNLVQGGGRLQPDEVLLRD